MNNYLELQKRYLERIAKKIDDKRIIKDIEFEGVYFLKLKVSKNALVIFFNPNAERFTLSYFYEINGIDTNSTTFAESLYPISRQNSFYDFNTTMVKGLLLPILLKAKTKNFDLLGIFQKFTPGEFEYVQTERNSYMLKVIQNGFTFSVLLVDNASLFDKKGGKLLYKEYTDTFDINRMAEIVRAKEIIEK